MELSFETLVNSPRPVLVDFWARWCDPCLAMHPVLDELEAEFGERIRVVRIDVDESTDLAVEMKVLGVPMFMIYKNGRELWRQAGKVSKKNLRKAIEQAEQAA